MFNPKRIKRLLTGTAMALVISTSVFAGTGAADAAVTGYFTELSGIGSEAEVLEYQEGGENSYTHKIAGPPRYSNIILR